MVVVDLFLVSRVFYREKLGKECVRMKIANNFLLVDKKLTMTMTTSVPIAPLTTKSQTRTCSINHGENGATRIQRNVAGRRTQKPEVRLNMTEQWTSRRTSHYRRLLRTHLLLDFVP